MAFLLGFGVLAAAVVLMGLVSVGMPRNDREELSRAPQGIVEEVVMVPREVAVLVPWFPDVPVKAAATETVPAPLNITPPAKIAESGLQSDVPEEPLEEGAFVPFTAIAQGEVQQDAKGGKV